MRECVGAGDRETETGAGDAVAGDAGPREAVEERRLELAGDPRPRVLDGDAQAAVLGAP